MGEDGGEKTEEPTPHKLREAKKKGQIAKSKDFTAAILIITSFYTLKAFSVYIWENISAFSHLIFTQIPEDFSYSKVGLILQETLMVFVITMAPIFGIIAGVALIIEAIQTGGVIAFDPIQPKFSKLNPIEGFKKFFSLKQYVELVKSVLKMAIVIYLLYTVLKDELVMVVISQEMTHYQVIAFVGRIVMEVVARIGLFYIIIAIADYLYQRYEYIKGLRMSKKEIKDEYKKLEGNPLIKQRQRDMARQMMQSRQMGSVPGADVVVTNPIHIAIAIRYKSNDMAAPKVVAKGKRLVAKEIRRIAEDNKVPIVENPPLAQALYKVTEVDMEVPPNYYKAVAEILAFVYNLKKKRSHRY